MEAGLTEGFAVLLIGLSSKEFELPRILSSEDFGYVDFANEYVDDEYKDENLEEGRRIARRILFNVEEYHPWKDEELRLKEKKKSTTYGMLPPRSPLRRPTCSPDDAEELADTSIWRLPRRQASRVTSTPAAEKAGQQEREREREQEQQGPSSQRLFAIRAKELVRNSSLTFGGSTNLLHVPNGGDHGAHGHGPQVPNGGYGARGYGHGHGHGLASRRMRGSMDISSLEVITSTGYPYTMETTPKGQNSSRSPSSDEILPPDSPSSKILHPMRSLFLDRISSSSSSGGATIAAPPRSPTEELLSPSPWRKDLSTSPVRPEEEEHCAHNTDEIQSSLSEIQRPELKKIREIEESAEEGEALEKLAVAAEDQEQRFLVENSGGGAVAGEEEAAALVSQNVVVMVVYDAERKPAATGLEHALNSIVAEGDEIFLVGYLQHIMSPMGHKMIAGTSKFIGINDRVMNGEIEERKKAVAKMISDRGLAQRCAKKKVKLSIQIAPGAHPRIVVVKEAEKLHATWVIFDKNAMKEKKTHYAEHLKCHVLRIKNDGFSTEMIRSLQGPTDVAAATFVHSMSSTASFASSELSSSGRSTDHSSSSRSNMSNATSSTELSPSIWSRFKSFGSWHSSSSSSNHHHQQNAVSVTSSSNQSSPRSTAAVLSSTPEEDAAEYMGSGIIPTVNGFSFDSPIKESMLINNAPKLKAFLLG